MAKWMLPVEIAAYQYTEGWFGAVVGPEKRIVSTTMDCDTAKAALDAAETWLREHGAKEVSE